MPRVLWSRKERSRWTALLFCSCIAVYAARTSLPMAAVEISRDYSWDKATSGLVLSCFFWGYMMTQVFGGWLADRLGGERVMIGAGVVWVAATLATPLCLRVSAALSSTPVLLILLRVLMGAAQGVHYPSVSSMTAQHVSDEERTLIYGTICAGSHVGTLVTGGVGSLILENLGWPSVFYFIGGVGALWVVVMKLAAQQSVSLARSLPPPGGGDRPEDQQRLLGSSQASASSTAATAPPPWRVLFSSPAFWSIIFGHFANNFSFFILLSWLPTYFQEVYPQAKGWVFNVVPWIVVFPMCVFGGWLANVLIARGYTTTVTRKALETVALVGCAFFLWLVQFAHSFPWAVACMAAAVGTNGFHNSGILVNPQDIAPNHAGAVFGVMNMAGAIPGFVGVYIAGLILGATGSWTMVFNTTAVMLLLGWLGFIVFGTGRQLV